MAPPIQGVLETSLYVSDLKRAIAFYRDVVGLRQMDLFDEGRGAAFAAGKSSVLLLFVAEKTLQAGSFVPHGTSGPGHIAFHVAVNDLSAWRHHLKKSAVHIEKEIVFSAQPPSIYFRDPDGNSLELAVPEIWDL